MNIDSCCLMTVFTPTYNRAYILPQLYHSLLKQTTKQHFEWLVIDDGSTDETERLVKDWQEENKIDIQYHKVVNGGKPRAINKAVEWARSPFLFILDSDDYITEDAIEFIIDKCKLITDNAIFVGIGVLRGNKELMPKKETLFDEYVDATNLERSFYGLDVDCNEVYKVSILKQYPFKVWDGEIFTPESVVLNEMALDGYQLRWFNKVAVVSEYLQDGMTKGGWELMKNNPMGYAMLFNHRLKYLKSVRERVNSAIQMIAHSILGGNCRYLFCSNDKILTLFCLPIGFILAFRRYMQYQQKKV